jgi:hypothetical protein
MELFHNSGTPVYLGGYFKIYVIRNRYYIPTIPNFK